MNNIETSVERRKREDHFKNVGCPSHASQPEKVKEIPFEVIDSVSIFKLLCVPFSEDAFEGLNRLIEKTVEPIECLTSYFDTCCCRWRLYYGTPSIENTLSIEQRPAYYNKTRVLQDLLVKMYQPNTTEGGLHKDHSSSKMFAVPENSEENLEEFARVLSRREWGVSEIIITRKIHQDGRMMLFCYFNRLCGSRTTAMYLFRELRDNIRPDCFPTRNNLMMDSRIPLLQFVEGITSTEKCEEHIHRYVCNDLLVREVCSFIPYRKYI